MSSERLGLEVSKGVVGGMGATYHSPAHLHS